MKTLAALLLLVPAIACAIPNEITAEYQLTNKGITIGRASESFVRKGDSYTLSSVSRSEGLLKVFYDEQISLQSQGRITAKGLQPLQFDEKRARDSKRDVNATFDWERAVMASRFRGETSEHALPRETQDRLSMMYQFMWVVPRPGNLVIAMSNGRKIEHYTYRLVDEVRIATPMGELDTYHFERVTYTPRESKVEVWLAKERDNFPVRISFDDPRGVRVEQTIVALQTR